MTETKRIFNIIEKQLEDSPFLAGGAYSIADIATFPWLKEYERYGIDKEQIPSICAWIDKLNERKAINKGLEALAELKE